jgi:hypothetical protein
MFSRQYRRISNSSTVIAPRTMIKLYQAGGSTFRLTPDLNRVSHRFCGCRILCVFLFRKGCGFRRRSPKPFRLVLELEIIFEAPL